MSYYLVVNCCSRDRPNDCLTDASAIPARDNETKAE